MYGEALCEAFEACIGPLFDIFIAGEDCVDLNTRRIEDDFGGITQAVESGRATYDGTKMAACVQAISSKTCAELADREIPECEAALDGAVALGDDCTSNVECEGTAYCKFADTCPGTCSALEAEGNPCAANDQCASGLNCSKRLNTCEQPAGPGDLCEGMTDPECELGLFCAGANDTMPGHCRTIDEVFTGAVGEPCDLVAAELCQPELVCEIQSVSDMGIVSVCAEKVGSGRPCRLAGPDQCPANEYCNATLLNLEGSCTPRPGAGDPCVASPFSAKPEDRFCGPNTRCDDLGTCSPLGELGSVCAGNAVCLSENCQDLRCVSASTCE
jgi:hypothetical protein